MPSMPNPVPASLLLNGSVLDDPYPFYAHLRETAPVWRVPGTGIVAVTRHALLEEATRRVDDFSSNLRGIVYRARGGRPARLTHNRGLAQTLATADPPAHGIHRKAVFPELVAKRMASMAPEIEQVTDTCLRRLLDAGTGDVMALLANPVPIAVVSKLVGFRDSDPDTLLQAAFDSTAIVGGTLNLFQLAGCMLRSFTVQRWVAAQLRSAPADGGDILSAVKRSVADGTLSEMEGRAIVHILLAAGGESTTSLIGNAVRKLAEDQDLQHSIRQQPELIPAFIEEVLRLESPFRCHLRSTARETQLGGTTIPAGATVLLFWAAGNRDPDVFAQPDTLDLTRPRQHMTFGKGIHTCVGAPLARLEALIVLRALLAQTRSIHLAPGQPPRWVSSLQVRRHDSLHVTVTR